MSKVNKVKFLSERTSGVPPAIFNPEPAQPMTIFQNIVRDLAHILENPSDLDPYKFALNFQSPSEIVHIQIKSLPHKTARHRLDVEEEDEEVSVEKENERLNTKDLVASELEQALRITQDLAQKAIKVDGLQDCAAG